MKEITLLTWLTQLGLSVVVPLAGWILLALWLRNSQGWGQWVIWLGIVLGMISAINGLIRSLKTLSALAKRSDPPQTPVSFNDHD
jgi:hypothetical protein